MSTLFATNIPFSYINIIIHLIYSHLKNKQYPHCSATRDIITEKKIIIPFFFSCSFWFLDLSDNNAESKDYVLNSKKKKNRLRDSATTFCFLPQSVFNVRLSKILLLLLCFFVLFFVCFLHPDQSFPSFLFFQPPTLPLLLPFSSRKGRPPININQVAVKLGSSSSVKTGQGNLIGRKGFKADNRVEDRPCSYS